MESKKPPLVRVRTNVSVTLKPQAGAREGPVNLRNSSRDGRHANFRDGLGMGFRDGRVTRFRDGRDMGFRDGKHARFRDGHRVTDSATCAIPASPLSGRESVVFTRATHDGTTRRKQHSAVTDRCM